MDLLLAAAGNFEADSHLCVLTIQLDFCHIETQGANLSQGINPLLNALSKRPRAVVWHGGPNDCQSSRVRFNRCVSNWYRPALKTDHQRKGTVLDSPVQQGCDLLGTFLFWKLVMS